MILIPIRETAEEGNSKAADLVTRAIRKNPALRLGHALMIASLIEGLLIIAPVMVNFLGCAPEVRYSKPGATQDDFYWDRYECIAPRGSKMDRPIPGQNELDRCLTKKGWQRDNATPRLAY